MPNGRMWATNAICGMMSDVSSNTATSRRFAVQSYKFHCSPISANNAAEKPIALWSIAMPAHPMNTAGTITHIGFRHSPQRAQQLSARCAQLACMSNRQWFTPAICPHHATASTAMPTAFSACCFACIAVCASARAG